jgi:PhoPQ-activated pathogenicity-related protein
MNRQVLLSLLLSSISIAPLALRPAASQELPKPFDYASAQGAALKPREIWPLVRKHVIPLDFRILSDEIVTSDTDPTKKLRKVTAHFYSQELAGKKWGHPCVIFIPADNSANQKPPRKGRVIIMSSPGGNEYPVHVPKYGEPIAARTGYPVMVMNNPGTYDDGRDIEHDIGVLGRLAKETGKNYYSMNCQLAVVYIQAMNAFQQFLGIDKVHAVIGGHSKRGRSAIVAAAMDDRVASAIIMGNEGVFTGARPSPGLSLHYAYFQDQVHVPVMYLGATNEDGYRMFNINLMQQPLRNPMTIEYIPNYVHSTANEIQFMDFLMWTAHVFDGRPITKIEEATHRRDGNRNIFTAKLSSKAKVQTVKAWYVYADNPAWRDLMWYHVLMRKVGDRYEGVLPGKLPDAFFIEVGDIAQGYPGYVSSLPQKLTDAPVEERVSRGSYPRLWSPE